MALLYIDQDDFDARREEGRIKARFTRGFISADQANQLSDKAAKKLADNLQEAVRQSRTPRSQRERDLTQDQRGTTQDAYWDNFLHPTDPIIHVNPEVHGQDFTDRPEHKDKQGRINVFERERARDMDLLHPLNPLQLS
jgi:hypothetical protein